jgi:hypothetical protein
MENVFYVLRKLLYFLVLDMDLSKVTTATVCFTHRYILHNLVQWQK